MTEAAIMKGLTWLKNNQDPDGGWGDNDKDEGGQPVQTDRNSMTGMALSLFGSLRIAGFRLRPHGPEGD